MKNKLLLTSAVYPFPDLPQNAAATDIMGQRFTRGNDLFTMVSHTHPMALHLLAQNLQIPSVVLEYPRWRHFCREVSLGYEVIGISAYPFHLDTVFEMCRYIRKTSPDTKIIIGSYAAQTLNALGGLEKYGDIIDELIDEEGISYLRRMFGEETNTPVSQRFFPKNGAGLRYLSKYPQGNTVLLFSGLGCPEGCDFCASSAMYKCKRIELLSPKSIIEHVQHYLSRASGSISQFYLVDEDYFRYPEYLAELRSYILGQPDILEQADLVAFGSVNYIAKFAREHGWEAIAEAGIGVIFIGVESQSAGGNGYDKRDSADAKEVFAQLHRMGIRTIGAWIAGFPFQNRQTMVEDLNYFISCHPTYQQLSIFSAFPGTPLYDSQQNSHTEQQCQFSDIHFWNPSSSHKEFNNKELLEITESGYALGYQTWGPSLLRNLEVHLNGIEYCQQTQSTPLHQHSLHLHKKNAAKIYTQIRVMIRFAPNSAVRIKALAVKRRYLDLLGSPTALQVGISWLSLMFAVIFRMKCSLLNDSAKTEGYRRYIYNPISSTTDSAPYVIDGVASLDIGFRLKRIIPSIFNKLLGKLVSKSLSKKGS